MYRFLSLAAASLVAVTASVSAVSAKDCKSDVVIAEGEPYLSRSLGAYQSSLFAWRKAAEAKAGPGFQSWRVAEDRKIDCEQINVDGKKRWVCTRSARPCKNALAGAIGGDKPKFDRILRRGDKGDDVRKLQEILNELGYEIEVDGDYGRGTKAAIRDFQKKNNLSADGNFGPNTAEVLLSKI
ncbi:MAG TPA: peptidoglycan-binding domain-containing protein [Hyphomicrobiaceae bacterium]|nr:peptidoglycan-binding domain-containing protein [Hyphomicrobiaceae bacterium]